MNFEQNTQLEDLIKVKLGYTEDVQTCENCIHSRFDDYHTYCQYSNVCTFRVKESASCGKFSKKITTEPEQV